MSETIFAALSRLERFGRFAENAALVILLSGMILLGCGQIILREIFATGVIWADEVIKLTVLWLAMVGSIAASRDNRHIRIDVLSHLLPEQVVVVTRMLVDVFAAAVCAVIAWQAWRYLQLEIEFENTVLIDVPAWIAHGVLPVAFALVSYRFIVSVLKQIHGLLTGRAPETAE